MKKPLILISTFCFLISNFCAAYTAHDVYQTGDQYLVNYNLVLADLSLEKAMLYFPTEADLAGWLLEHQDSKTRINRTPGRIIRELQYRIEPGQGSVVINDHNRYPPYYIAYEETDDAGATWNIRCEWSSPESARLLIESILADSSKRLAEMPPLEVTGIDYVITPGEDRVVFIDP